MVGESITWDRSRALQKKEQSFYESAIPGCSYVLIMDTLKPAGPKTMQFFPTFVPMRLTSLWLVWECRARKYGSTKTWNTLRRERFSPVPAAPWTTSRGRRRHVRGGWATKGSNGSID